MKELNATDKTICALISAAVFGREPEIPDGTDWSAVYEEISLHTVPGLFRNMIPALGLPAEVRKDWESRNLGIIAKNIKVGAGQRKLTELLDGEGIPYAILKGTAAAAYYPTEHSRTLGDVDFIVGEKDFEATLELLSANGYTLAREPGDNYRHESFNKDGVHYECHRLFADRNSPGAGTIDGLITDNIENAVEVTTEYGSFKTLPTAINGLVLLEHVAIHIKAGLGLRQIVDWLLYASKELNDGGWDGENGEVIRAAGLDTLAKTITRAGQLYFGLDPEISWCRDASEDVCGELVSLVFSYGNFGNKNTVDDKVVGVARRYRRGVFRNLRQAGERNWKALRRHPRLKPLAPFYQIGRYTKQVFTKKGALKALTTSKKAVDDRERLMRELGI